MVGLVNSSTSSNLDPILLDLEAAHFDFQFESKKETKRAKAIAARRNIENWIETKKLKELLEDYEDFIIDD
jgi:hypothetical protein